MTRHHHLVKINGVKALYLNNLLRSLAGSLVGIFFPAYVYLWGYQTGGFVLGIKVLILAIVFERLIVFFTSMLVGKIVLRLGFKKSILASNVMLSLWFVLPAIFSRNLPLILVLSVVSGLAIPIYWLARLSILSIDGDKDDFGHEVSTLSLTDQVAGILGPFAGGIIVSAAGFGSLFGAATFICILSSIPIFFVGDYKIVDGISLSRMLAWVKDKKERHLHVAFFGQGIANFVDGYFWPLFIFIFVGSFALLGIISSITVALSSVAIFLAGRIFDTKRAKGGNEDEKEYTVATIVLALITFFRPLLTSIIWLFSMDAAYRIESPFWSVDYEGYLYSAGKRQKSPLEFYSYRETLYSGAWVIVPILLLIFLRTTYFWWIVFGIGSVGTLLTLGMQKES